MEKFNEMEYKGIKVSSSRALINAVEKRWLKNRRASSSTSGGYESRVYDKKGSSYRVNFSCLDEKLGTETLDIIVNNGVIVDAYAYTWSGGKKISIDVNNASGLTSWVNELGKYLKESTKESFTVFGKILERAEMINTFESANRSIDLYKATEDKPGSEKKVKTFSSVPSASAIASLVNIDTGSEDFQVLTDFLNDVKKWYNKGCRGESPEVGPIGKNDVVLWFK